MVDSTSQRFADVEVFIGRQWARSTGLALLLLGSVAGQLDAGAAAGLGMVGVGLVLFLLHGIYPRRIRGELAVEPHALRIGSKITLARSAMVKARRVGGGRPLVQIATRRAWSWGVRLASEEDAVRLLDAIGQGATQTRATFTVLPGPDASGRLWTGNIVSAAVAAAAGLVLHFTHHSSVLAVLAVGLLAKLVTLRWPAPAQLTVSAEGLRVQGRNEAPLLVPFAEIERVRLEGQPWSPSSAAVIELTGGREALHFGFDVSFLRPQETADMLVARIEDARVRRTEQPPRARVAVLEEIPSAAEERTPARIVLDEAGEDVPLEAERRSSR